jgi:hypothetical protein
VISVAISQSVFPCERSCSISSLIIPTNASIGNISGPRPAASLNAFWARSACSIGYDFISLILKQIILGRGAPAKLPRKIHNHLDRDRINCPCTRSCRASRRGQVGGSSSVQAPCTERSGGFSKLDTLQFFTIDYFRFRDCGFLSGATESRITFRYAP